MRLNDSLVITHKFICQDNQPLDLGGRMQDCLRLIHWTRSPASEATRNSSHLKDGVQPEVRPL